MISFKEGTGIKEIGGYYLFLSSIIFLKGEFLWRKDVFLHQQGLSQVRHSPSHHSQVCEGSHNNHRHVSQIPLDSCQSTNFILELR